MLLLLLPLLLCAGAVLSSADTREAYDLLPDNQKPGVDLALQQLNVHAGVHHHFRFLRSVYKSDMEVGPGLSRTEVLIHDLTWTQLKSLETFLFFFLSFLIFILS